MASSQGRRARSSILTGTELPPRPRDLHRPQYHGAPRAPTFTVSLIPSSTEVIAHLSTFIPTLLIHLCSPRSSAQCCTVVPQDLWGACPMSPCCRRASAPTVRKVDDWCVHTSSASPAFLRYTHHIINRELRSPSGPSDATPRFAVASRWPLTPPPTPTPA
jgi:hypothetical protein